MRNDKWPKQFIGEAVFNYSSAHQIVPVENRSFAASNLFLNATEWSHPKSNHSYTIKYAASTTAITIATDAQFLFHKFSIHILHTE